MKNFLFVCTGNTCRSPMAEAVLTHLAGDEISVQSAGLFAAKGSPANDKAIKVLKEKGISISHHSQPLSPKLLEWADIVLTMTTDHKQTIIQRYSNFIENVFTLKEYVFLLEGKEEVWKEINRLYTEIETKRIQFMMNNGKASESAKNEYVLEHQFLKSIEVEYKKLKDLEQQLPSFDITDPFGGSVTGYRNTLKEIYEYIHKVYTNNINS
jgi:protein-tyrosine-phosphatase